ncbi:STAS/SEC14 domain-containing protein [Jannaschia rubra]|jgi:hypothetical protein|uniref:STAS/SEC14 domain-containing protein n=1 Tax=Jannaschia rubra TaxID=282197 RepID=A0A0M6XTJ9_9RHOB|nr:STAS/SEC14 domain-containing protein [Jannaschia rubra]CTQ34486.1 hypothetical protein JAN5088_03282 [Jannaschia rubra]
MWKDVTIDAPGVVALACAGKLSERDLDEMHAWIDRQVARHDRPALVILMGAFEGYESSSALWADMKLDARHAGDFARVALVADETWIEWATKAGDPLTRAELRCFAPEEREAAIAWAASGVGAAGASG